MTEYNFLFLIGVVIIFLTTILFGSCYPKKSLKIETKKRLPMISICLNKCVITVESGKLTIDMKNLEILFEISKISKLYLIAQLPDDITDTELINKICKKESALLKYRIMTCSTAKGRGSMVNQLQPILHVDVDKTVTDYLKGKVANVITLEKGDEGYSLSNLLEIVPLCNF